MEINWTHCLAIIREEEGGNDDDPYDRGGRTSRGIIQREYDAYRQHKKLPIKDVWKADDSEIDEIYHISYWDPWCPMFPNGIDLCYFNLNVNDGIHESTVILQRALGVKADGHIGIVTRTALEKANLKILIPSWAIEARKAYRSFRQFRRYGKGWLKRTDHVERLAMLMIL